MDYNGVVNETRVERFWSSYKACVEACHVSPQKSGHYVRWVQEFVDFQPATKLRDRSAEDIQRFLKFQSEQAGVAEWQVKQAAYALRLLYEQFLPSYHPEAFRTPKSPGMKFRDQVLPGEAERRHGPFLEELRTVLRERHYSYKTETSYMEWVRRFLAFHNYADPRLLAPELMSNTTKTYQPDKGKCSSGQLWLVSTRMRQGSGAGNLFFQPTGIPGIRAPEP